MPTFNKSMLFYIQPWRWRQYAKPKWRYPSTKLRDIKPSYRRDIRILVLAAFTAVTYVGKTDYHIPVVEPPTELAGVDPPAC
jgi:hypothetical protein